MPFYPRKYGIKYFLGFLNSTVAAFYLSFLSPTVVLNNGELERIPVIEPDESTLPMVSNLATLNIAISKLDWDSFETSWDFKRHPLL